MTTLDQLYAKMRREAEARRRALLMELSALEEAWDFPRTVLPREERRRVENETWMRSVNERTP